MLKVMFVCTGNTCRSPMAEYALKSELKARGAEGVKVTSAGVCAADGDKINEKAKSALKKRGITVRRFEAKRVTAELAKKQNAIICMSQSQARAFVGFNNVYTIGELAGVGEISDPYGLNQAAYDDALSVISRACNVIAELLIKELAEEAALKALKAEKTKKTKEKTAEKSEKINKTEN